MPFSEDGFVWTNCTDRKAPDSYLPSRFAGVTPIDIEGVFIEEMCESGGYAEDSPMCHFYDLDLPSGTIDGGVLLYGIGTPYGKMPLSMAFIRRDELGVVENDRPKVYYFNGNLGGTKADAWSNAENESAPLPMSYWIGFRQGDLPCDEIHEYTYTYGDYVQDVAMQDEDFRVNRLGVVVSPGESIEEAVANRVRDLGYGFDCSDPSSTGNPDPRDYAFSPTDCMPSYAIFGSNDIDRVDDIFEDAQNSFGLFDATLVVDEEGRAAGSERWRPRIAMLYNKVHYQNQGIGYQSVALSEPWAIQEGQERTLDHNGYGALIFDEFTKYDDATHTLTLYHTISSWHGPQSSLPPGETYNAHPYGVYSTFSRIPWTF